MKKLLLLPFLILSFCISNAQSTSSIDTIEYARAKAYQKDFKEADRLLTTYSINHSDVNALRLHAQVLYWLREFTRSEAVYENLLSAFPDVQVVKLDYARMLYELNKLQRAEALLKDYLLIEPQHPEANIMLANMNYWKGHFKMAREKLSVVLTPYPGNETALAILKNIRVATAPYIKVGAGYASDDQPLKKAGFDVEAGWFKSWLFSPIIQASTARFDTNYNTSTTAIAQLSNNIIFGNSGLSLRLKAGIFYHPAAVNTIFTGGVSVNQQISRSLSLSAETEKKPYQYTRTSVSVPVMQQFTRVAFNFNRNDKWLGKAAYELQSFDDANKIQTLYAWALVPLIHKKCIKFKAGYAFTHANADRNTFTALKPLSAIIATTAPGGAVAGYYNPYFTPTDQTVNSILSLIEIALSKSISFSTNASIGILASSSNPELIFTKNSGNVYSINRNYNKQSYTPFELQSTVHFNLSDRLYLMVGYEYNSLLFYRIQHGSLSLKYAFVNEKKS